MAEKTTDRLERVPPQAPDIERAVIGAMFFDNNAVGVAVEMFKEAEDYFYQPAHAMIFRVMTDLYDRHLPIDQLTVGEELKKRGQLEKVGGEEMLAGLIEETTSAANIRYHCHILIEKALLRKLISITGSYRNQAFDDAADPSSILDNLEQSIMNISQMRQTRSFVELKDTVHKAHEEIQHKSEVGDGVTGIDTGFNKLNRLTAGWQPSDIIILAGRPSMGTTALALDMAKNAARNGVPVLFFSLEMSSMQLVMRMLYNEARFDGSSLHSKKPSQEDWTRLSDACARLYEYPIYIDDTPGLSTLELSAKAKRIKNEKDIGLIVVDYLQLMQGTNRESRQQEISSISRGLKGLAKELKVPIIALSQLSRALEQRGGDHRPLLSDLRESGAIEQDADVVMFIYRASVYDLQPEYQISDHNVSPDSVAELIIRKQRNGPIGTILLHWTKEYTRFQEFDYTATDEFF